MKPSSPVEVVHRCPPDGEAVMPCCGRSPWEVPRTDRMTRDETTVTCGGVARATDWARSLTWRHFPQMIGTMCPMVRPHPVVVEFDHVPSGDPYDLLVLSGPHERGFSSYGAGVAGVGGDADDQGYVLAMTPAGHVLVYRADGHNRSELLGIAEAAPGDRTSNRRRVEITGEALIVTGDGLTPLTLADATHRGRFMWLVRKMHPGTDPRGVARADYHHPALHPPPLNRLWVRYVDA